MKYLALGMFFLIVLSTITSCSDSDCRFNIEIKNEGTDDSAGLYIYEPGYKSVMLHNQLFVKKGNNVKFFGKYSEKKLAYIKFSKDSILYHIVLDSVPIFLEIRNNKLILYKGSPENRKIFRLSKEISKLNNLITQNRKKYLKSISDSTLNTKSEEKMNHINKKLTMQKQQLIMETAETSIPASFIVLKRFGNELNDSLVQSIITIDM